MKLLFKQQPSFIFRFYVTNQNNEWLYIIKKMAIMYQLYIYDAHENIVAVEKEFSYFIPFFLVDYRKWNVGGEYVEYNYEVKDENDYLIGRIEKRS